jgi:hypothetical protein
MNAERDLRESRSHVKSRSDKVAVVLIWLVIGWVVWDFMQWIDPPVPRDLITHPLRISPHGP